MRRRFFIHCLLLCALLSLSVSRAGEAAQGAAWVVDWDFANGWEEAAALGDALSGVQVFGATFDTGDRAYINEELERLLNENPAPAGRVLLLTVVNDAKQPDGLTILKDPDLVSRLMATPESREQHRRDLLRLLDSGRFGGLDMDYERIKEQDWPAYLAFCHSLWEELKAQGKQLRVVLEPKPGYYRNPLPPGPEYVVMAYNLFGSHSGPGPKANPAFLGRLAAQARTAKAELRLALSTGGFLWRDKGKTTSLTETQAAELAVKHETRVHRDPASRYLHFSYDVEGEKHTVWYADATTMQYLVQSGRRVGFTQFDIWRLGGNSEEALEAFGETMAPRQAGGVLKVGDGFPYSSVAAAVAAARPGDHIEVAPGVYHESITVTVPGLTISCPKGMETDMPVTLSGPESAFLLRDSGDTVWRGIRFSGHGDGMIELNGFSGRFEHCAFTTGEAQTQQTAVLLYNSNASFHGCVFQGRGGIGAGINGLTLAPGQPHFLADFTYCLFEGYDASAARVADDVDARFANCLFTRNGHIARRATNYPGQVEIVNSVLYHNTQPLVTNATANATPLMFESCVFTPSYNQRLWAVGELLPLQPGVVAKNCIPRSPRFIRSGRPLLVNLGIDDTINLGVFEEICREADKYGFKLTHAVDTRSAKPADWELVKTLSSRGHEFGSHTSGRTAVEVNTPMALGYLRAGTENARLDIEAGQTLSLVVDSRTLATIALRDLSLNLAELGRRLSLLGAKVAISPYFNGAPAFSLDSVDNLDIAFSGPVVPLYLRGREYLEHEIGTSIRSIREHIPEEIAIPFINPFAVTSALTRHIIAAGGYSSARAVEPLNPVGQPEWTDEPGRVIFNIFNIPCSSFNSMAATVQANPVLENFRLLLDFAKETMAAVSFYSHTYRELTREQWHEVFRVVADDPNVRIATLSEIAGYVKETGIAQGDGFYSVPLPEHAADYRPGKGSPLLKAGKSLGLTMDFAGNPVPDDAAPTIGLYQQ